MLHRYHPDVPTVMLSPGSRPASVCSLTTPKKLEPIASSTPLAAYTLYGGPSIVVDFGTSNELRRGVEER